MWEKGLKRQGVQTNNTKKNNDSNFWLFIRAVKEGDNWEVYLKSNILPDHVLWFHLISK